MAENDEIRFALVDEAGHLTGKPAEGVQEMITKALGKPGGPGMLGLSGTGRPDMPDTLSPENQEAVKASLNGATFTSTDGAGVGAWAWVKTPTGWQVTYGDTGWRDITDVALNKSVAGSSTRLYVRRQAPYTVEFAVKKFTYGSVSAAPRSTGGEWLSEGFRNHYTLTIPLAKDAKPTRMITNQMFVSATPSEAEVRPIYVAHTNAAPEMSGGVAFSTADSWPVNLPGEAA